MVENTIERCARAIAEVRMTYRVETHLDRRPRITGPAVVKYDSFTPVAVVFHGTEAACQAWIDREAARACVAELVGSEKAIKQMATSLGCFPDDVRTAITAVLEGRA